MTKWRQCNIHVATPRLAETEDLHLQIDVTIREAQVDTTSSKNARKVRVEDARDQKVARQYVEKEDGGVTTKTTVVTTTTTTTTTTTREETNARRHLKLPICCALIVTSAVTMKSIAGKNIRKNGLHATSNVRRVTTEKTKAAVSCRWRGTAMDINVE